MGLGLGLACAMAKREARAKRRSMCALARLHSTHSKPIKVDAPSSAAEHWRRGLRGDIGEM